MVLLNNKRKVMSEVKSVMFGISLCEKCKDTKITGDSCIKCKLDAVIEAKVNMNIDLVGQIESLESKLSQSVERESVLKAKITDLDWQYEELMERRTEVRKLKECLEFARKLSKLTDMGQPISWWRNNMTSIRNASGLCLKQIEQKESENEKTSAGN